MKQILHIFRKDVSRHWPEIAACLVLLALYAWREPLGGLSSNEPTFGLERLTSSLLPFLVPIAWCFLIIRSVQSESLVGDRQFWVTRPYRWQQLLTAKVLLIIAFINVPLFIVDLILLKRAGFSVAPYVTGLLYMQVLIFVFLVLSALTAAVITSTIPQTLIVALAAAVYLIGVAYLSSIIPASDVVSSNLLGAAEFSLFVGACLVVILLQYACRKTWQSRVILACAAGLVVLVFVVTPYSALQAKMYPLPSPGEQPLVRLVLDSTSKPAAGTQPFPEFQKEIEISVPVLVSGVETESVVSKRGLLVTLRAPDGFRWNSGWTSFGGYFWPGSHKSSIDFTLKRDLFERMKSTPLTLQFYIALAQYRKTNPRTVVAAPGVFSLPNDGKCRLTVLPDFRWTTCWAPLKTPSFIAIVNAADTTCPAQFKKVPIAPTGIAMEGDWDDSFPASGGISPVEPFPLYFNSPESPNGVTLDDRQAQAPPVCAGTPITFYSPQFVKASRVELTINQVRLDDLAARPMLLSR